MSDAIAVVDDLEARPGVDASRIGSTGVSLGGMHTWLLAAADERIAAAAPAIGVQSFRYALDQHLWDPRVNTIRPVFDAASEDLHCKLDTTVVEAVWDRLTPGLADAGPSGFDAPVSLPLIAPRPLLVLSAELDPRCPLDGVRAAVDAASVEYGLHGAGAHFRFFVEQGVGHSMTPTMWEQIHSFFSSSLLQSELESESTFAAFGFLCCVCR